MARFPKMSVLALSTNDRLTIRGVHYAMFLENKIGVVLRRVGTSVHVAITRQEFTDFLAERDTKIEMGFFLRTSAGSRPSGSLTRTSGKRGF